MNLKWGADEFSFFFQNMWAIKAFLAVYDMIIFVTSNANAIYFTPPLSRVVDVVITWYTFVMHL